VTEHGGMSSHAAIIARSLGVPAMSGVHGLLETVKCGDTVLIDADRGRVFLDPDRATLEKTIRVEPVDTGARCLLVSPRGLAVLANAGMMEDVEAARRVNADGIGLFRTEFAFIRAGKLLSESEQASYYSEIISKMDGKPVTIRLLDIGGDKPLPFLSQEKEENPMLGVRGARFLLKNPEILRTQVKALARAARNGPVNVLVPMVIDAAQLDLLLDKAKKALKTIKVDRKNIRFGAMFEVPGACLQAGGIFKKIDFASIGSNDLFQYLFAMDRDNEHVSAEYDSTHPVFWELIAMLAREAKKARKPLSLCGEMAAVPGMAKRLVKAGITSLSVSPRFVPAVRNEIARIRR
jgi:phosphotransferase system enzyme I (PtsI)